MTVASTLRHPSALLPLFLSLGALAMVVWFVAATGWSDSRTRALGAAWQVLMVAQVPAITYFALRWLPRAPRPALIVLTLQVVAATLAAAPVLLLGS